MRVISLFRPKLLGQASIFQVISVVSHLNEESDKGHTNERYEEAQQKTGIEPTTSQVLLPTQGHNRWATTAALENKTRQNAAEAVQSLQD